jgi:endonuclease III
MAGPKVSLVGVIDRLESFYGRPDPPEVTDPLEMILFENIAYLAADAKRLAAWKEFRKRIGTKPARILAAAESELLRIARAGILAGDRVEKVKNVAAIALEEFGGDLDEALDVSPGAARKALKKFPGIGAPAAERILLFSRREKVLAFDSNGLRVLLRLGYGKEAKSYAASYRSAQEATRPQWRNDFDWLNSAHQLLRRHGQELCKRTRPLCERCPLTRECAYFRSHTVKA